MNQITEAKTIRLELFAPGMTPLHRAGLGGLACTLHAWQRARDAGSASRLELPFQFKVNSDSIVLHLPESAQVGVMLRSLFEFGFQINADGLIYLPGQFQTPPDSAVLADLQAGSLLTFLQHGSSRKLAKNESQVSHFDSENGDWEIPVTFRKCSWFKHQTGWKTLIDSQGELQNQAVRIDGAIYPGASVRHFAYKHQTAIKEPLERVLPLYFALVGCLSLPVNRGVGVLLIPEVKDLREFIRLRHSLNPQHAPGYRVTNAADAILQAKLRVGARLEFSAVTFQPTSWARQQKSRVKTCEVGALDDSTMDRFRRIYAALPPRIVSPPESGNALAVSARIRTFQTGYRVDSVVRSLIADNLVAQVPWYSGFSSLMSRINPVTGAPFRDQVLFERRGLRQLVSDQGLWDQVEEWHFVKAIQGAVTQSRTGNFRLRGMRFDDQLRLKLTGVQTVGQLRSVLTDLFDRSQAGPAQLLEWYRSLTLLGDDWQRIRDLSLLALVSSGSRFSEGHSLRKTA
ncbi:CRISPR-associated protein Cas8a1/Csx13 [Gimesia panareensis]|uniref:CRISPR-associated protein Cas8a1/Csx13 n=1 Tax=Gimesia panareensis TaxID=2527978 RepID=A0A517Q7S3_9PLAN|nr:type I-MYXAN CRISPR-associated Cas8a1/Cmx1 [Gimesia panareensis]QDT27680.1 CRISPR-associated protein Cas8a1/Csx13 [Gimesia panareensis]